MTVNQLFKQSTTGIAFQLTLSGNMVDILREIAAGGACALGHGISVNALYNRGLIDFRINKAERTVHYLTETGNKIVSLLIDAGLIKVDELRENWEKKQEFLKEHLTNSKGELHYGVPEDFYNPPHPAVGDMT